MQLWQYCVFNKHNTARVASCWFIIYYRLMMHRNSNIKLENILCVSLLVEMMFLWAKLNVEVCLVVFMLRLVAQCALRSPVTVSVKECYFPVL